jgi:hypothetical protein
LVLVKFDVAGVDRVKRTPSLLSLTDFRHSPHVAGKTRPEEGSPKFAPRQFDAHDHPATGLDIAHLRIHRLER